MAKKKTNEKKERESGFLLSPETVESIAAIGIFLIALIFILAYFGQAGKMGGWIFSAFSLLLGKAYFLLPTVLVMTGCALLFSLKERILASSLVGASLLLLACLGLVDIVVGDQAGGLLGVYIAMPFVYLFDRLASMILFSALIIIAFLIIFNASLRRSWRASYDRVNNQELPPSVVPASESIDRMHQEEILEDEYVVHSKPRKEKEEQKKNLSSGDLLKKIRVDGKKYTLPPLDLLDADKGKASAGDIKANANIIQRTLQDFGIPVEIAEVSVGPSVTQYAIKPAQGIKLSRIVTLQNDLSLALAAHPLRIEAPIPGKSFVGIEIPNRSISLVGLRSLLDGDDYQKSGPLVFALGRDVGGQPVYADLARMPHLLIAGSTGSGKSVSVHSFLMGLLYKNTPLSLRLLLVDPKRVELAHYQDIPHLLTPVITESKETIAALRWAVKEMDGRYKILQAARKRDIVSYNSSSDEFMPYIVIVIDELADLMAAFGREVEASIIRLAQMARAVGIHLVLSTQRPSVEVITGLIKANITSRIAFQVASQIDSRTILDAAGAEKLLGNGDMLFLAGDVAKPRRIQGAFVSELEVKKTTDFIREQDLELIFNDDIIKTKVDPAQSGGFGSEDRDDALYDAAYGLVMETGKASATFLQRHLKVGYARAARLLDILEERGVIGPGEGAKTREILIDKEDNSHVI